MRKIRDVYKNAQADRMQYKVPQFQVRKWFHQRKILIATDIWIYPDYPDGWEAILGAWDRVWILKSIKGVIWVKDIQPNRGFNPNGTLIVS